MLIYKRDLLPIFAIFMSLDVILLLNQLISIKLRYIIIELIYNIEIIKFEIFKSNKEFVLKIIFFQQYR